MSDLGSGNEMRHLASSRSPKSSPNLSGGWVVMLLSGLIAAVLFLFATQQSGNKVAVVVLAKNVSAGQTLDATYFGRAEISAGDASLARLIKFSEKDKFVNQVASGPLEAGDLLSKSFLRNAAAANSKRSMSIAVDRERANNGNLRAGDRIDIIDPENPDGYVAKNIEIITVSESGGSSGLAGASQFVVVVGVDEDQALKVSQAIQNEKFDIIRTTGASSTPAATGSATSSTTSSTSTTTTTSRVSG